MSHLAFLINSLYHQHVFTATFSQDKNKRINKKTNVMIRNKG